MNLRKLLFVSEGDTKWYNNRWFVMFIVVVIVVGCIMIAERTGVLGSEQPPSVTKELPTVPIQAELTSITLATGVDAGCKLVVLPLPHAACHIGFQPGNTLFIANALRAKIAFVSGADITGFAAGLICAPLHLTVVGGILCAAAVALVVLYVIDQIYKAADAQRCFGVKFNLYGTYTTGFKPYGYGGASWRHPIWYAPWNQAIAQWRRKDSCAVNVSNSSSRYFFSRHCRDAIYDSLGGSYPQYARWNYDGWSCEMWNNMV